MQTLWQKTHPLPRFPHLSGEIKTDVLVIGGGMAGLLTAYSLSQKGIRTVLVEQGRICGGTTAGTTAKITAQHGLVYQKLLRSFGKEYAGLYYRANAEAVEDLKKLCKKADCPLEEKDNFVYSEDRRKIEKELTTLQTIGVAAKYRQSLPIPVAGEAVGFENQGQFHPLQLAAFLAKDLTIYENTRVTEMIGTTAVTEQGKIRAEKVVVATHFPLLNKHGSYFLKLYQHRSYVLALEGAPLPDAMYVSDSKKGFSFSSFGSFLLLGGGGHRTGKQGGSYSALRDFRAQHYPAAQERFAWAAQDTMSLDSVPYIGNYSKNTPDLYVATGFNKWGMTGSMVSARLLGSMISGEDTADAFVFSSSRSILKPQLLLNAGESTVNLLWPTTRRCPHLGCALHYNKQEHSWDCACHGSRFSEDGKVLNNPANKDLE